MDDPFWARGLDLEGLAKEAGRLLEELFPICRSITGQGVRDSLKILQEVAPFQVHEVPSGTACFDWTVPLEWNAKEAWIKTPDGRRVADFGVNNLHLVSYSEPFEGVLSWEELRPHLHTLPDKPKAIPYRTSYYNRTWGFCLSQEELEGLEQGGKYEVLVRTSLEPGSLTHGEARLEGDSGQEFLISTYCCHPSLANDNLSGPVLWALLLRELGKRTLRHSYRFIIVPETIGAIAFLSRNQEAAENFSGAFVLTTCAGPGPFGYKESFCGDAAVDRAARAALAQAGLDHIPYPFDINGSDEKHFSAPWFRVPTGSITKDKYYEYPEYHTSLDNLSLISPQGLVQSLGLYLSALEILEKDLTYTSLSPRCAPMLSKRGLYPKLGGAQVHRSGEAAPGRGGREWTTSQELDAINWLMFLADGAHSLLDVAERTGLPVARLQATAEKLRDQGLLELATTAEEKRG